MNQSREAHQPGAAVHVVDWSAAGIGASQRANPRASVSGTPADAYYPSRVPRWLFIGSN